jgi:hypothetical protein
MATIIKPSEVPKYVPGAVTAASDDLGWNGVWLRGYRYAALDVIVPTGEGLHNHIVLPRSHVDGAAVRRSMD